MSNQLRIIKRASRMRPYPRQTAPVKLTMEQTKMLMPDLPSIEPDAIATGTNPGLEYSHPVMTIHSHSSPPRRRINPSMMALLALSLSLNDKP